MLFVIDDVFSTYDLYQLYNKYNNLKNPMEFKWVDLQQADLYIRELSSIASKLFDLSSIKGYELWSQYNSRTDWHYDKDEKVHSETGQYIYPPCSIIFYPHVDKDLVGGVFQTDTGIEVQPKTNRAIVMAPGVFHNVTKYTGERFSLLVNPWNRNVWE